VLDGGREGLSILQGDKRRCGFGLCQWGHAEGCGWDEQLGQVGTVHAHRTGADTVGVQPTLFEPAMERSGADFQQFGSFGDREEFGSEVGRLPGDVLS